MKKMVLLAAAMMLAMATQAQKLTPQQVEKNVRAKVAEMKGEAAGMQRVKMDGTAGLAVFNIDGGGFVIASCDSRTRPVLAYSPTGGIDPQALPPSVSCWLEEYQRQMDSLDYLRPEDLAISPRRAGMAKDELPDSVAPLLVTEWNQYRYGYNSMVPFDSTYAADSTMGRFDNHPTVGCVALAMGQIMRYWQFPRHGYGQHSYTFEGEDTCWHYGVVGADFSSVNYDYDNMPYKLSDSSTAAEVEAVAILLFHCGVACNMHYNSDCQGSSGASLYNSLAAMNRFFHFNGEGRLAYRNNSDLVYWDEMIKADLAAGRPVLYAAQSYRNDHEGTIDGAHAFVLDGYDSAGLFHVNWGWNGQCNGYYATTVLRPLTQYDFTPLQYAIFGLEPAFGEMGVLVMGGDLTMDQPEFYAGDSIRGQYSITNIGDSTGSMFVGVNIYGQTGSQYYGCVDGRRVTVAVGDTVVCRFAYPLALESGTYRAVMQYSRDSFYAGIPDDLTYYMEGYDHANIAEFGIRDTTYRELSNLVVFVRFKGDPEIETGYMTMQNLFSRSETCVERFFEQMSYGRIRFNTVFAQQHRGNLIVSYEDPMPRGYFRPYSDSNTIGYTMTLPEVGISLREAELIARVARYIDSARLVPQGAVLDGNGDGNIDNVSIVVKGDVDSWDDMLWPHMEFFPHDSVGRTVTIGGKRLHAFNFEFEGASSSFTSTTFSHEMCHSLGLPDLYHYHNHTSVSPVPYDLMATNRMCHPAGIYKHKILHVTDTPVQIVRDGSYMLCSNGGTVDYMPRLYYIKSAIDSNQWYTIEYRNASDPFEDDIPYSGLLIGRWMDTATLDYAHGGNSAFDYPSIPNNYWVFRPGSSCDTVNGHAEQCLFSPEQGPTEFGPQTDPHPYTADGRPEQHFRIYNITPTGTVCRFSVEFLHEGMGIAEDANKGEWSLYPNPATGHFTLEWKQGDDGYVAVMDAVGHEVMRQRVAGGKANIDARALPAGIYFVALTTGEGTITQKLILK